MCHFQIIRSLFCAEFARKAILFQKLQLFVGTLAARPRGYTPSGCNFPAGDVSQRHVMLLNIASLHRSTTLIT